MKLTLTKAARSAGKSKGTLSKALVSGALSGAKLEDGSWQIDPAELHRWVSATRPRERLENRLATPGNPQETPLGTPEKPPGWDAQMALMRERLDDAAATIVDLRRRLDAAEAERRAVLQRLLPPPSENTPPSASERPLEKPRRRFGWWGASKR